MSETKELKSIDLSSFTIIGTGINIVISLLLSIIVIIAIGVISPVNLGVSIYIVPTIIVGSFMCGIYQFFSNGFFYNLLSAKLRNIKLSFNDDRLVIWRSTGSSLYFLSTANCFKPTNDNHNVDFRFIHNNIHICPAWNLYL